MLTFTLNDKEDNQGKDVFNVGPEKWSNGRHRLYFIKPM